MHIGLIGGIGPAATIAYYNGLVRAFDRAQLPLELTIVHADVKTLIANAGNDLRETQADIFAKHLSQLEGAGCDVAAITALTGHFCFDETLARSPIPLMSAIEPIDQHCDALGHGTIGLLGGPSVLSSHLFGKMQKTQCVIPQSGAKAIGELYLEIATSGACSEMTRQTLFRSGAEMINAQNADAILLAGTDLGLAFGGRDPGFKTIDALEIHIEALVALAQK